MIIEKCGLPFQRGTTFSQAGKDGTGAMVTLSDTIAKNLEGRLYQVPDTIHNTGHFITLRIVKNDSGATMAVARKFLTFTTASVSDWGRRVLAIAGDNQGERCKPMDDAYFYGTENTSTHAVMTTIADDDLFYVVEEGPCLVETASDSELGAADQGIPVTTDGDGRVELAVAGDAVNGIMLASPVAASTAATANLIYVRAGVVVDVTA